MVILGNVDVSENTIHRATNQMYQDVVINNYRLRSSLIFFNLFIYNNMDDIINLFTKEHGIYNQKFKFHTILFFIIVLVVSTKFNFFNNSVYIILTFVFALLLTNLYVKVNKNELSDKNKTTYLKLESLQDKTYQYIKHKINISSIGVQKISEKETSLLFDKNKLDSLYIDSNMIDFLYSIIQLYEYNENEYYLLLKGTNNILKLRKDIETFYDSENSYPENIHEMLQIALQLKINCMNNIQNFIYSVPKTNKMYTYIDDIIQTYNILVTRNIKIIHQYHLDYIKKNGINNATIFIDINSSKGYDQYSNHSIIPGKNQNKHSLIDLYI